MRGGIRLGHPEIGIDCAFHVQRLEHALGKEAHKRLARHLLDDQAGGDIAGVGILPLAARREIERRLGPAIEDLHRLHRLSHRREAVVLRPEVTIARCVAQELADRHLVGVGQPGEIVADRVVERKLALVRQHQDRSRGELLGDRRDRVARGDGRRLAGRLRAIGVGIDDAPVLHDRD